MTLELDMWARIALAAVAVAMVAVRLGGPNALIASGWFGRYKTGTTALAVPVSLAEPSVVVFGSLFLLAGPTIAKSWWQAFGPQRRSD